MGRFEDGNLGFLSVDEGFCNLCKHKHRRTLTCEAFPGGIPDDILTGEFDHRVPYGENNTIVFEPIQRPT